MKKFIVKNKFLCFILVISILLVLKFSEIPYPFRFLYVLNCFMEKPLVGTWTFEIFRLLENLSLAYIASFIFFVVTIYYPQKRMQESAFSVMEGDLINLYLYMSNMISSIKYVLKVDKLDSEITNEDLAALRYYQIEDTTIKHKTINIIDGKETGECADYFNSYKDLYKYGKLVKKILDGFTTLPCVIYSDFELQKVIASIQVSQFFKTILNIKEDIFIKNNISCEQINFDTDFADFIKDHENLKKFQFKKHDYKRIDIDDNEVKKNLKEQAEMIAKNPELINIINVVNSQKD